MSGADPEIELSLNLHPEKKGVPFLLTPCDHLSDVRTIVCGHSHMAALATALTFRETKDTEVPAVDLARQLGMAALTGWDHGEPYLDALRSLVRTRNVMIAWNGNQPIADFLLTADGPFDFVPRGYPDTSVLPDAPIVPEAMLRAHFAPTLDGFESLMGELRSLCGGQIYVLPAPPPLGDNELIRSRIAREAHFVARAAVMGVELETVEIMPPSVRLKLWFALKTMMEEIAARHRAVFIPPPAASFDEDGFLKVPLAQSDVSHANVHYGRHMMLHLAAFLET